MEQLVQKHWGTWKEIKINQDSLTIRTKNISEDLEYKVKFDELGFDIIKKRIKSANIPFYFFMIMSLLFIIQIISSVVNHEKTLEQLFWLGGLLFSSFLSIATYNNRNKDVVYLTGGQRSLELLATKPNKEVVLAFIDNIHKSMRIYYKTKYTTPDPGTSYEQRVHQIKWLKEITAITEKEYFDLVEKSKGETVIGFQRSNKIDE